MRREFLQNQRPTTSIRANAVTECHNVTCPAAREITIRQPQEYNHDAALSQWGLEVECARYEAERAERQYKAVDPENRLVARGLEKEWETRLQNLTKAEAELFRREQQRPRALTEEEQKRIKTLGSDLRLVWDAPTTSDRDRKELLRTLLEEVILKVERKESQADLILRWRGGMTTKLDLPLKRYQPQGPTTDEDTLSLLRRLAATTLTTSSPAFSIAKVARRRTASVSRPSRLAACVAIMRSLALSHPANCPWKSRCRS
jgi:hypothetical protein